MLQQSASFPRRRIGGRPKTCRQDSSGTALYNSKPFHSFVLGLRATFSCGKMTSSGFSPMKLDDQENTNSDASDSSWMPPFHVDQRVFAQDQARETGLFYPGIVRQARRSSTETVPSLQQDQGSTEIEKPVHTWSFLIHYLGWNARWDQWVSPDRILADTPENKELVDAQQKKHAASTTTVPPVAQRPTSVDKENSTAAATTTSCRKRKKERTGNGSSSNSNKRKSTLSHVFEFSEICELPFTLKTVLVDEWEQISRVPPDECLATTPVVRSLHVLPAPVTIRQVLNHFSRRQISHIRKREKAKQLLSDDDISKHEKSGVSDAGKASVQNTISTDITTEQVRDFCKGLTDLFQEALPKILLYPHERPQFENLKRNEELMEQHKEWVDVYGCEYLLRLYLRLPALLQVESASQSPWMAPLLVELLVLLQKNRQACFKSNATSYRIARRSEWLEWEQRAYPIRDRKTTTATADDAVTSKAKGEATVPSTDEMDISNQ